MTVMQLLIQPFGIMNALRMKFLVPISATGALATAVAAPKSTAVQILRAVDFRKVKPVLKPNRLEWTLLVASFMMIFSVTWFVYSKPMVWKNSSRL